MTDCMCDGLSDDHLSVWGIVDEGLSGEFLSSGRLIVMVYVERHILFCYRTPPMYQDKFGQANNNKL